MIYFLWQKPVSSGFYCHAYVRSKAEADLQILIEVIVGIGCEEILMSIFIISSATKGRVGMLKFFYKMLMTDDTEQANTYPR